MANRPIVSATTTWRATQDDLKRMEAIAAALRSQAGEAWPTRTSALRFALQVVAGHLQATGRLHQGVQ